MIAELLGRGKGQAVSTQALSKISGINDVREMQKIIAKERKAGAVILSSCSGGYYLPATRAEAEEFVRSQDKKARSIMVAIQSARRYIETLEGQIAMTEGVHQV